MPDHIAITDNVAQHRFELEDHGARAELVYDRTPQALVLIHTEVPPAMRGGGVGGRLVEWAVADARRSGRQVIARCPFAREYLKRHPELLAG
jgi:predicted GNAT family acetyltransferase